ncbi:MAG: glycoside hydrolase family 3 C-terminal domain-containing protein [Clostridia bacterium]|nr:glycoside hydrolase family 3 C-terminal domain-containing protein [Clostridia bacterium]
MLPYKNPALSVSERVDDLLSRMTDEEKVAQLDMIRGVELAETTHPAHFCSVDPDSDYHWDHVDRAIGQRGMGFVHDVYSDARVLNLLQKYFVEKTRLGIPCIFTGEALHGISYPGASSFPMPIALGATFDPDVVHRIGHAIGKETRTIGITEILAPNLDLAREPRWGRVEETFGEDTYLSSQMAYAIITGEQNHGDIKSHDAIVCEPKHYVGHGVPEGGTNCSPLHAGVREVETYYLPVFEAGIKKAGAYCAMAAYHNIDGEAVVASDHYLREVLKERFGMRGYVRADFGSVARLHHTHHMTAGDKDSIATAVNAGLDVQGFDYPNEVWQRNLLENLADGTISREVIDDAVSRVLRVKFELGLFENPYVPEGREGEILRCQAHKDVSLEAARKAITLLQNKNGILPLKKDAKVALLGPSSGIGRLGSYSSTPWGYHVPSVADALREAGVSFTQCSGCGITPEDVDAVPVSWYPDGVQMEYYSEKHFGGVKVGENTMRQINFSWILAKPHRDLPFNNYSVRMTTRLCPDIREMFGTDVFEGRLIFTGNNSARVYINGEKIIDGVREGEHRPWATVRLAHGVDYEVVVELPDIGPNHNLTLSLDNRSDGMDEAIAIAKESDIAVIVCGDDKVTSGEGMDRNDLRLYGRQQELIRRVAETGTPVVLVLENGKPVDLSAEVNLCDGILECWFVGEMGAYAIAEVLTGERAPAGRLPITFPKNVGCLPCYYNRLPGGSEHYLEGSRAPLFPFGPGLSYTHFDYGELRVEQQGQYDFTVSVDVTNAGQMDADEVVQLYVRDVVSTIVTPDRSLAAFRRVHIPAGKTVTVTLPLTYDAFKLLNRRMEWVVEPGDFDIMVGASSTDIRQSVKINVE